MGKTLYFQKNAEEVLFENTPTNLSTSGRLEQVCHRYQLLIAEEQQNRPPFTIDESITIKGTLSSTEYTIIDFEVPFIGTDLFQRLTDLTLIQKIVLFEHLKLRG